MRKAGMSYQEDAAAFFQDFGLKAEVEALIVGARGSHRIDVWVTGLLGGFEIKWVVECKDWRSSIPKEKVLVLQSIVQDVGADRGWLLSEESFQSGAVHCARNTNLVLASLSCLREGSAQYITEAALQQLLIQLHLVQDGYQRAWTRYEQKFGDYSIMRERKSVSHRSNLMVLGHAVLDAIRGEFPTAYSKGVGQQRVQVSAANELVKDAGVVISDAREDLAQLEAKLTEG